MAKQAPKPTWRFVLEWFGALLVFCFLFGVLILKPLHEVLGGRGTKLSLIDAWGVRSSPIAYMVMAVPVFALMLLLLIREFWREIRRRRGE